MAKTSPSSEKGVGSIPDWWGAAKIPHASWPKTQNVKQKQYHNKFNTDFKYGPYPKSESLEKKKDRKVPQKFREREGMVDGQWSVTAY